VGWLGGLGQVTADVDGQTLPLGIWMDRCARDGKVLDRWPPTLGFKVVGLLKN